MIELIDHISSETEHRKGRTILGHICSLDDGSQIYLAKRKHGQMYRAGCPTLSEAMTKGLAGWAFSEAELLNLRLKRLTIVGVRTTDTHDHYLTELAAFSDHTRSRGMITSSQFGSGVRLKCVPLAYFERRPGRVELPLDAILT